MLDPLSDCSPLISAASSGKLRLVRLLVEGGAEVNGRNPKGETALLAACKALRGEPAGPETIKLLTYLLQNKADPNAKDRAGRTALMYACMERAGAQVAATLLAAGADPSMEDYSGASALVYAINEQHQPTLKVLMDACQARGRDIIIIATELGVHGGPVTRRYLNVLPSPNISPVSCMSPSDIVLKTGSPNSPEGENIFNFRATSQRGSSSSISSRRPSCEPLSLCSSPPLRQRISSEPWLAIHNLACLNRAYEEGMRERSPQEERDRKDLRGERGRNKGEENEEEEKESHFDHSRVEERRRGKVQRRDNGYGGGNYSRSHEDFPLKASHSVVSLTEMSSTHATPGSMVLKRCVTPAGSLSDKKLPTCLPPHSQLRRNTLPSVTVDPPLLHLPPLVSQSTSYLQVPTQVSPAKSRTMVFLPHPPSSSPPSRASVRPAPLPPLPSASSVTSLVPPSASCYNERNRRSLRRHSVQLEQLKGGTRMNYLDM
ncbi:ankyrin repeat domain-containing protein 34B isoform X2 [Oreochromis niloticus]|nr:ankyrin repeat domain-containing protein 34B isoform X2 [Oreochromis niloticus]XP_019204635.1 ankyrin repeat domain-containing protein 34B isoform X2 [Oreochromis niloticus]XP_019204636.1 ankyrin repeat domain-containing protein 34B isoform X2 [Oreochromis niloticus]XP_019204637.1 ankyrin repeat domain-containing protein 34B isoform X2 [Oreochromis niloticus]XP_019204639.1 ankyrin repeat domain-containing protein 34B isoform X2 [Oreochromis niloticus]XP_025756788.1 ankyrin repeat domain-con